VLLSKSGKPEGVLSSYRPFCLLDDVSNNLEVLLVGRIEGHMTGIGPGLSDAQFGFRKRRSTDDALRVD